MLSAADNEFLTKTGPGTRMGKLFRRYWIPALLPEELPHPDCPPVRVTLLGENLVAFRDSEGKIGLLEEGCAHRKVSLYFGQNLDCGLRCPYHGWKYDVNGSCVDMPSEPAESKLKNSIKLRSYPCKEFGGVIWTYMGPEELTPELPVFEWSQVPDNQVYASKRIQRTNYAQSIEGGIDSSHVSFLHADTVLWNPERKKSALSKTFKDGAPRFFIEPTDYGMMIGARRNAGEGNHYWRITQFMFPWYTMIPASDDKPIGGHAWVPIDDENCMVWSFNYHPVRPLTNTELHMYKSGGEIHTPLIPGSYLPVRNKDNDYLIDRDLQKGASLSGIKGISAQDMAMQESMGPIVDRTTEHLGTSDTAVIMMRRLLMKAANDLETGAEPPGIQPESQRVRSISITLPEGESWIEATEEARKADKSTFMKSN
jgi:phthalate 4,5-dioxygenase oxygenase subunit